jgi:hypothetical protein
MEDLMFDLYGKNEPFFKNIFDIAKRNPSSIILL